mgnify:CR=1 FL=1
MVFLQDWRATLVPATTVPVTIVGAFAGMAMLGFTINRVTLFALILSLGLLVDDPIVDVENIFRHFKLRQEPPLDATLTAAHVPHEGYVYKGANHGFHNDTTPRYDEAAAKLYRAMELELQLRFAEATGGNYWHGRLIKGGKVPDALRAGMVIEVTRVPQGTDLEQQVDAFLKDVVAPIRRRYRR